MKLYVVLAIAVCQLCHHFARADLDSRLADPQPGPFAAGTDLWPSLVARGPANDGELSWSGGSSGELVGDWLWPMAVKRSAKADIGAPRRRSALDKNFMRFGRAGSNLMRFGRPDRNFLRFGRKPEPRDDETELSKEYATSTEQLEQRESDEGQPQPTVKRNAGNSEELLGGGVMSDSGELKPKQVVYYRRDSPKNLMRFGKRRTAASGSGYLRFGRGNLMRFGRRSDEPGPRTVRAGPNMMRFGRSDRPPNETAVEGSSGAVNPTVAQHDPLPVNLLELLDKLQPQDALVERETESAPDERVPLFVVEK